MRRSAAVLLASAVIMSGLTACDSHLGSSIGAKGGLVGDQSVAQVSAPAGAVNHDVTVKIRPADSTPAPSGLDGVARALGSAVDVTTSGALPGAQVRLPYDSARDAVTVGGKTSSAANVFIAVYNPGLKVWVPLATTIDSVHHQLVAVAPHFSLFRKFVVDPISKVWDKAVTGLDALRRIIETSWRSIADIASPRQEKAECDAADPDHDVTATLPQLHGCVVSEGEEAELRLENRLLIPLDVNPAAGVDVGPFTEEGKEDNIVLLLTRFLQSGSGLAVVGGRSATHVNLSPVTATEPQWAAAVRPDLLAIALDAILTTLAWIPSEKEFELAVIRSRSRLLALTAKGGTVTMHELVVELRAILKADVSKPEVAEVSEVVATALECEKADLKGLGEFSNEPSIETGVAGVIETAKSCVTTALKTVGKNLKQQTGDIISVLASLPDSVRLLHEVGQEIGLGFTQGPNTRLDVTYTGSGTPETDPTTAPPIPSDTVPLPRDGEDVFKAPNQPPYAFPPRHSVQQPNGFDPCGRDAFKSAWLEDDGAWEASYSLGNDLGAPYSVRLYRVSNQAALTAYLAAAPKSCSRGGITFTRTTTTHGQTAASYAGTIDSGSAKGIVSTGFEMIYGDGYFVYIIDNAVATTGGSLSGKLKARKDEALDYLLRKADTVLNLNGALAGG